MPENVFPVYKMCVETALFFVKKGQSPGVLMVGMLLWVASSWIFLEMTFGPEVANSESQCGLPYPAAFRHEKDGMESYAYTALCPCYLAISHTTGEFSDLQVQVWDWTNNNTYSHKN